MRTKTTYRGKIARLPKVVREELNRRIENGETGRDLIAWLNMLSEIERARPINAVNFSRWKNGGYRDWLNEQQALAVAGRLAADSEGLKPAGTGESLADQTAVWLAARLLVWLEQAGGLSAEGEPDLGMLRQFCRGSGRAAARGTRGGAVEAGTGAAGVQERDFKIGKTDLAET